MKQLRTWPNNRGRAEQHAPYARRRIDSVVGPGVPGAHSPAWKMAFLLHALHEFALRCELHDRSDAMHAAAIYEELTGEALCAELTGMELTWKQNWLADN